jgi:hypothetical protein
VSETTPDPQAQRYVYFVAYRAGEDGSTSWIVGNTEITSREPITRQEQIRNAEELISSKNDYLTVVLTGYQLMRTEPAI